MLNMKNSFVVMILGFFLLGTASGTLQATEATGKIPDYVLAGLQDYKLNGYEAAVKTWLANSPYENATTLASSIAFFKNIEKLAGKYVSYDILMAKETASSNAVYVRMNFERVPGYILFTSFKRDNRWVLGKLQLDRMQKFGTP